MKSFDEISLATIVIEIADRTAKSARKCRNRRENEAIAPRHDHFSRARDTKEIASHDRVIAEACRRNQ
jgi:hypothetical protein